MCSPYGLGTRGARSAFYSSAREVEAGEEPSGVHGSLFQKKLS